MDSLNTYLPELIAFHDVARFGGFTQAAEIQNVSKGQLSKQVARLEAILNAQLFHRTTRKITLTEEGKHLFQYAESIVRISRDAALSMKELTSKEGGLIRITSPSSFGDWFVPELLNEFQKKLPKVKIEIDLSTTKRDLIADNIDFALRAMDETNPDLIARYIGHIKDVIVASPAYLKKQSLKGNDPQELKDVPVLLSSLKQKWNSWKLKKGDKDFLVDVQGNYASTSYQTNRQMCLEGLGVARLPYYLVKKDIEEKKLIHLYKSYTISTHPLYLVYPGKGQKSVKHQLAKDLIWSWMKSRKVIFEDQKI